MAKTTSRKRQPGAPGKGRYLSKSSKKQKKSLDYYEASDSDPDEEKHAERYDKVDNYEYELPSDFEDEEIDEDLAFTEEDKKKYAGWFGDEEADEQIDRQHNKRKRGEFAELDSSSQEEADEDEDDDIESDEGEDDAHGCGSDKQYQQVQQQHYTNVLADSAFDGDLHQHALPGSGSSSSDDDDGGGDLGGSDGISDELDEDRHRAMLAAALGKQLQQRDDDDDDGGGGGGGAARRGVSSAARNAAVIAEAYPESEAHAAATAPGELRLSDLLGGLSAAAGSSGRAGLGGARKLLEKLDTRSAPITAPLPRTVADRLERKAGYDDTTQEVTKWQPIVKANREAPTLRFTSARHEVSAAAGSTAALVAGFTPDRSDPDGLEAQVAALLGAAGTAAAAAMDEAQQALAEKAYSSEEAAARAAKLSRMRHLMFYAELKAKRLARIKSKDHHRRANRAAKRAAATAAQTAGEQQAEAREAAEEAEFERAKERLTLKHKNSSKWARRALKRGAAVVDVSTREALAAQLALGQQLRRKMEGRRGDSSGSQDDQSTSASEPEDAEAAANTTGRLMSSRNRKEALAILKGLSDPAAAAAAGGGLVGEDDSSKRKGLFALPFMVRALEKQRAAAAQEAAALLADMDTGTAAAAGVGGGTAADEFVAAAAACGDSSSAAGRMTFGGSAGAAAAARAAAVDALEAGSGSDEEEDVEAKVQRLSRHITGDTAAATAAVVGISVNAAVSRPQQPQLDKGSSKARQWKQQNAAVVGTVEIELPSQGADAGAEDTHVQSAAGAATNSSAHADLFISGKAIMCKQQQQQHHQQQQQQPDVAGGGPPSSAVFIPCATWQGLRQGYVFKRDKAGLGYHRDSNANQQDNNKQPSKAHQQQQKVAAVQSLLLRQQQQVEVASSDVEAATQQQQQQEGVNGSSTGIRGRAAAAAVDAMQLLSGEGDLQRQLLSAAFAGDDVEAEFAADKSAEVEAELPPDQAVGQMPGWGTWKTQQREPAWMAAAKANAAAQRAAAAASRKDAQLKHVVISEKWDKRSAKYLASTLPFPFRDKDVYETAIRQPLGRQYNPDAAFRNLTRPAVLKDAGVVIEPLRHSKHVEQYNSGSAGKGRAVVTVAGGMQLQGQAAGTGAGGWEGPPVPGREKGQGSQQQKLRAVGSKTGSFRRGRLHDAAQ